MEKEVKTHRYVKDGQERVVTGTQEEVDAEIAGVPWEPLETARPELTGTSTKAAKAAAIIKGKGK